MDDWSDYIGSVHDDDEPQPAWKRECWEDESSEEEVDADEDWEMTIYKVVITYVDTIDIYYPSIRERESGYFTTYEEAVLDTLRFWREEFKDVINVDCADCINRLVAHEGDDLYKVEKCLDCSDSIVNGLSLSRSIMAEMMESGEDFTGINADKCLRAFFGKIKGREYRIVFKIEKCPVKKKNARGSETDGFSIFLR
nr:hypothetical protein [Sicyoidochytrium minutum DNA virus]